MKKYCYYTALLAAALVLGGCSKSPAPSEVTTPSVSAETTPADTTTAAAPETTTQSDTLKLTTPSDMASLMPSGFTFSPKDDVMLYMHKEAASVLDALGEPLSYMEAPNCAFLGTDRIYSFGGYEVTTYEKNSTEYIYDIYFLDDSVTTAEGIYIGCSKEDMEKAYGTDYEEESGSFIYTKDGMTLQFIIENDTISAIRYNVSLDSVTQ